MVIHKGEHRGDPKGSGFCEKFKVILWGDLGGNPLGSPFENKTPQIQVLKVPLNILSLAAVRFIQVLFHLTLN